MGAMKKNEGNENAFDPYFNFQKLNKEGHLVIELKDVECG